MRQAEMTSKPRLGITFGTNSVGGIGHPDGRGVSGVDSPVHGVKGRCARTAVAWRSRLWSKVSAFGF
jgi:hypothetical protein